MTENFYYEIIKIALRYSSWFNIIQYKSKNMISIMKYKSYSYICLRIRSHVNLWKKTFKFQGIFTDE